MIVFTDSSYNNHNLTFDEGKIPTGKVAWQSPSNIALVKYWGKHGQQLPQNPSLSFSLKNACSKTQISYKPATVGKFSFSFLFEGKEKPNFEPKLNDFFERILLIFPFLNQLDLHIESSNSFPHSSGIASSASAMSALALCLCSIEKREFDNLKHPEDFSRKASFVARLGSGSAARSVFGGFVNWGKVDREMGSSDYFGDRYSLPVHANFTTICDTVVLVSGKPKAVSSTHGHQSMANHAFAHARYAQARSNYLALSKALEAGDFIDFARIVENEALSLHAMMLSAAEGYFLLQAETLRVIEKVRAFRKESGVPVCFTLDAGPNVHVLFPLQAKEKVMDFLQNEVVEKENVVGLLEDEIGDGPIKI